MDSQGTKAVFKAGAKDRKTREEVQVGCCYLLAPISPLLHKPTASSYDLFQPKKLSISLVSEIPEIPPPLFFFLH